MQIFVLCTWSNFVGTPYQLSLCDTNIRRWLERVVRGVWAVPEINIVVMGGSDFTAANALGQLRSFAARARKGDWIVWITADHGTDEYPLYNESGVLVGRQQAICSDDFGFDKPGMITAPAIFSAMADSEASLALFADCCTFGRAWRDSVDKGLERTYTGRIARYLPNPAWAGKRAFRDLPVTYLCPEELLAVLVAACDEGETAPDIDEGGFTDLSTRFITMNPDIASGSLIADAVGHALDPSIGDHPVASGPIADKPIAR